MNHQASNQELRDILKGLLERYRLYLNGPVPSDLLFGKPDVEPIDTLLDGADAAIKALFTSKYASARHLLDAKIAELEPLTGSMFAEDVNTYARSRIAEIKKYKESL